MLHVKQVEWTYSKLLFLISLHTAWGKNVVTTLRRKKAKKCEWELNFVALQKIK